MTDTNVALWDGDELYKQLMHLCDTTDTFFFSDQVLDDSTYRIFNYRLSSYSEFLKPGALDCRGIMYRLHPCLYFFHSDYSGDAHLVCRPMQKFFNLNENPFTMDLDLSIDNIKTIEYKEDGSLISTFIHNDKLYVKSKGSIKSEQVVAALKILENDPEFANDLYELTKLGFTINMEYTSPNNRIVLPYTSDSLTILNAIYNCNGEHISVHNVTNIENTLIGKYLVAKPDRDKYAEILNTFPQMTGIEGFIVYLNSGEVFKIKTDWYLTQHRCIDTIGNNRRLYEAILAQATDDIKTLFSTNQPVLDRINHMELFVASVYNTSCTIVTTFVDTNKSLDRKSFAILGQQYLGNLFSTAMNVYIGRGSVETNVHSWMLKNYDTIILNYSDPNPIIIEE
jgi:T4 RnlA family RNA ligase